MSDSHDICRSKVCVICSRKATRKKSLSTNDKANIKAYIDPEYNYANPDYPTGISNGCYLGAASITTWPRLTSI